LNGVVCARSSTCVAVGDGGTILRSTDGGSSSEADAGAAPGAASNDAKRPECAMGLEAALP
jgi:photosystem II stability/assembly factor-like uncharacterized protein